MGIVLTADGAAEALAPMAGAAIRDRTGSYGDGFLLLLVLAAVGATAVALLPGGSQRTTNAPAAMREAPPAPSPAVH